jgi:hypothetical protein
MSRRKRVSFYMSLSLVGDETVTDLTSAMCLFWDLEASSSHWPARK